MKLKEEEEESIEEVVEQASDSDLLLVKRVLVDFKGSEEEPKEDFFPSKDENTLSPTPLPPFKLIQKSPQKNPIYLSPFLTVNKPT